MHSRTSRHDVTHDGTMAREGRRPERARGGREQVVGISATKVILASGSD